MDPITLIGLSITAGGLFLKVTGPKHSAWRDASTYDKQRWVAALTVEAISKNITDLEGVTLYVYDSLKKRDFFKGRSEAFGEFYSNGQSWQAKQIQKSLDILNNQGLNEFIDYINYNYNLNLSKPLNIKLILTIIIVFIVLLLIII